MKTIYLIRHGETDSNKAKKFQGRINTPLNEKGLNGAKGLVERFENIPLAKMYCSTLKRTFQTAEPLATAKGISIEETEKLQELSFGQWEGMEFGEISKRWPNAYEELFIHPTLLDLKGEENFLEAMERGRAAIEGILKEQENNTSVAAVSHGGLIRLILCSILQMPADEMWTFSLDNVGVTGITYTEKLGFGIKYINNTGKL